MTAATPTIPKIPDQCAPSASSERPANGVNNNQPFKVDYLEAGSSGPVVMLVHSSVSGARQWRRLMDALKDQCRVRAANLFGYGETRLRCFGGPRWRPVEAALPPDPDDIYLVDH